MKLNDIFGKLGRSDLLSGKIDGLSNKTHRSFMELWLSWYRGNVAKFHWYKVYNGKRSVSVKRRSAGMAKTVCEDWASLLLNEKTDITVSDEGTQAILEKTFEKCDFWKKANQGVEKAFALGIGAFVVRVDNLAYDIDTQEINTEKATAKIEFVSGMKMYPLTVDDEDIVECAFVTRRNKKVYISMHILDEAGNYEIHNITGEINSYNDIIYDEGKDYYIFDTKSPLKWFQVIKPNIANNICPDSPLGISVYANAVDSLETTDIIYDSFGVEFQYGRKRVYASAEAMSIDAEGNTTATFDENDVVFYRFPKGTAISGADEKPYVQESTGDLRADSIIHGINQSLNILSTKVGLGENRYRFDKSGIATATQVISENSSMFRTVKRHEIVIESALIGIVRALLYAINNFTAQKVNENVEINVKFDDSIIEDKATERERDKQDVAAGLMAKWEYRVKWYKETPEQAKKWESEYNASRPKIEDYYPGGYGT